MSDDKLPAEIEHENAVTRDNLGRFVKGVSGNPKGRRLGSKNRTTLVKQFIDEALTQGIADNYAELVGKIMELALEGDKDMLKFLLGDVIKEARKPIGEDDPSKKITGLQINITQFTGGSPPEQGVTITQEDS